MSDIEDSLTFKHDRAGLVSLENDTLQIAMPQSDERSLYEQQVNTAKGKDRLYEKIFRASGAVMFFSLVGIALTPGAAVGLALLPMLGFIGTTIFLAKLSIRQADKIDALHDAEKTRIKKYFTENSDGKKLLLKLHVEKLAAEKTRLTSALDKAKQDFADMGADTITHDAAIATQAQSAKMAAQPIVLPSSAARPRLKVAITDAAPRA